MNKTALLAGVLVGVLAIIGISAAVYYMPSAEEESKEVLNDAYLPGSKEFEDYNKEIIITTDTDRLQESRTAMGDIVMRIGGRIRNKGNRTISGLEISVGMVDTKNRVIKEKKYLIIPNKYAELGPKETIDVDASVAGFRDDDERANARWRVTAIKFKE